jgi:hypothetical protein
MKNLKNEFISFRISKELLEKVNEFAKILELNIYGSDNYKASRSLAIRLAIEDTLIRFFGPKENPDDIESPHYYEMSKIIPILKNIKMKEKLDGISEEKANIKEEVIKIIKKYA